MVILLGLIDNFLELKSELDWVFELVNLKIRVMVRIMIMSMVRIVNCE